MMNSYFQSGANPKTIVIIYLLYFGDMICLSPFLEVLRRESKDSKIVLVMDAHFQEAVKYNPNIDVLVPFDRHGKEKGLASTWKLGQKIGKMKPDLLIVPHGTSRSTVMALAMKPKYWTGEEGTRFDHFFMDYPMTVETYDCNVVDKFLHILQKLGIKDIHHSGMKTYTCPAWEKAAAAFYASHHIHKGDKLVGLSVGSSTPEKNWPAEKFGQTADHFAEKGYFPIFFGVKSELPLIQKAQSVMKHPSLVAAGQLSMGEFMAASSWCSLFFTNDSGPMYVADSQGVPTISLFGPSNAKLHHPLGPCSQAISSWDIPYGPEHVNAVIRSGKFVPMDRISVDTVIQAGEEALAKTESLQGHTH